uniref:Uncharacterized protein n=1 Tax=Rhizophora mucronata TaxID=61149 RepID=A0A2P2N7Z0_RHIMU
MLVEERPRRRAGL